MGDDGASLYLELLKRCVCNLIYQDPAIPYLGEESMDPLVAPFSLERDSPARIGPDRHTR